jgi:2-hydroxy-6-oxonona-2,4-dienedioate hydrolase
VAGARAILSLLDGLGIEKASLGGNAMKATLWFALHHPERLERLIVMGPATSGGSLFAPIPTEGNRMYSASRRNPTAESMRSYLENWAYDPASISEEMVADHLNALLNPRSERPGQPDLGPRLGEIKAKTLIIWGSDGRQVPFDECLRLLAIPNAQLQVFSRCGHWPELEQPDAFNRVVLGFLSDLRHNG